MKQYPLSVIIFHLDQISGIHKQYNQLSGDMQSASTSALNSTTFQYQKLRPQAMDTALNIGKNLTIDDNLWVFYVCSERKAVQELKE